MNILVFNAGSSTVKFRLIDAGSGQGIAGGVVENIGARRARQATWWYEETERRQSSETCDCPDHEAASRLIFAHLDALWQRGTIPEPRALAHRVVHGGERFSEPVLLDDATIQQLTALDRLAPLHNPPALALIEVSRAHFPDRPQVAVFDTAFHNTLPPAAYRYAVPERWYDECGMRRYGFHGISHAYVAGRAAERLGRPLQDLKLITLHLGNGASVAAIDGGCSVETSMGMTPLEGLVMGTRSGDVDVAGVLHVGHRLGLDTPALEHELTCESGLKALCNATDMREIVARVKERDARATLAFDVYIHRLRKYIGAFTAVLGGLDALVFTAGVGEHQPLVRERACAGLEQLGIALEHSANDAAIGYDASIHTAAARVATLVICTDEEQAMARQILPLLS